MRGFSGFQSGGPHNANDQTFVKNCLNVIFFFQFLNRFFDCPPDWGPEKTIIGTNFGDKLGVWAVFECCKGSGSFASLGPRDAMNVQFKHTPHAETIT